MPPQTPQSIRRSRIANRGERIVHLSDPKLRAGIERNLPHYSQEEQDEWRHLISLVEVWELELSR